jgi:hypothetical protein
MRLVIFAVVLALSAPAIADTPGVKIFQPKDQNSTEGDTTVDGEPNDIFAACIDYAKWTDIFPDVAKVIVTAQHGVDAKVTLVSPSGHRDNLHFHNQPAARMIYFEDTGNNGRAEVWAEIMFVPGDKPHTTRVHIKLYAEVKGIASIVVSDSSVRKQREQKIEGQLEHIRTYFVSRSGETKRSDAASARAK